MSFDAHKNDLLDIAWAAGLFEGEGCIIANRNARGGKVRLQVVLGSTDRDIVERYAKIVNASRPVLKQEQRSEKHRTFYVCGIYGRESLPVLEMFLPFLGERRRAKALEALALGVEIGIPSAARTHCPQGHEYNTENTYLYHGSRRCRACWPIKNQKLREARKLRAAA